jgi:hypothetical protein
MQKCVRCGKRFLFQKLDKDHHCRECARVTSLEGETAAASERLGHLVGEIQQTEARLTNLRDNHDKIYTGMVESAKEKAISAIADKITRRQEELSTINSELEAARTSLVAAIDERKSEKKKLESATNRLVKIQTTLKSLRASMKRYFETGAEDTLPDAETIEQIGRLLEPTVKLHFHSMDVRELKKRFSQNAAVIRDTLARYQDRYTTKANLALYQLMVIGLEAELQNVLNNLSYDKIGKSLEAVAKITGKYEAIASSGNQSIAPTVKRFIGEIRHLYEEAVRIEYEYYVKKQRIKEEQRALREQMREEAADRKRLEEERWRVQAEESKYLSELENLREQLANATEELKRQQINDRMVEVKGQLDQVEEKKEGILRLQHGKAGYVYVISNFGSFGENVFKIGMTRRLQPLERIYELGDASVPFRFDVHCMIFSDNAPELELNLHRKLHQKRMNKVNLRREYFFTSVDELEGLVYELEPSAEFSRTMLAEEYRQSLEMETLPDAVLNDIDFDDEEEQEEDEEVLDA